MPPCDICGKEVDYHIKHFSSEDDPHIHICDECVEQLGLKIYFLPPVDTLKAIKEFNNGNT